MSHKIDWTTSPILLGSAQFTSDQSGIEVDIIQRNVTNTTTVRMIFIGSATIKTSTNTSALRIYVDGAALGDVGEGNTGTTNSTIPSTQTVMGYITLSPGAHTVKMTAKAQDGNTTATVASYRRSFLVGWCA